LQYTRNLVDLDEGTSIIILNIIRLILIVGTLYFLKWPPFTKASSKILQLRELSYLMLLIPLIFPHQQKYAFALALPAMFYLSNFIVRGWYEENNFRWNLVTSLTIISFILMTLSSDSFVGRDFNKITQHYKTITWGAVLLIPALAIAERTFKNNVVNNGRKVTS